MPNIEKMRTKLGNADFSKFKSIKDRLIKDVDNMAKDFSEDETIFCSSIMFLVVDLLFTQIPEEDQLDRNENVHGGVFDAETGARPLALHYDWYVFRCCYAIWIWKR